MPYYCWICDCGWEAERYFSMAELPRQISCKACGKNAGRDFLAEAHVHRVGKKTVAIRNRGGWDRGHRSVAMACHPMDAENHEAYLKKKGHPGIRVDRKTGEVITYGPAQFKAAQKALDMRDLNAFY